MSKFFSWFFIVYFFVGSLCPRTDFAQLWHAGSALEHFRLHVEESVCQGENFTLLRFLYEHYVDPDSHTHGDDSAHKDLPAQHFHAPINFAIQDIVFLDHAVLMSDLEQSIGLAPTYYSFLFGQGVYRPPSLG